MKNFIGKKCKTITIIEGSSGRLNAGETVKIEEYLDKDNIRIRDMAGRIFWVKIKQINL